MKMISSVYTEECSIGYAISFLSILPPERQFFPLRVGNPAGHFPLPLRQQLWQPSLLWAAFRLQRKPSGESAHDFGGAARFLRAAWLQPAPVRRPG